MEKDYYKILSIEPTASQNEIEKAATTLLIARNSENFKNDPNSNRHGKIKMLSDIHEAIFILNDPARRLEYDLQKGFKKEPDNDTQGGTSLKVKASESIESLNSLGMQNQVHNDDLRKSLTTTEASKRNMEKDYYKILAVEPFASQTEIEEAANRLLTPLSFDNFRNDPNSNQYSNMLSDIDEAIFVLRDPVRRLKYDLQKGFKEESGQNSQEGVPIKVRVSESTKSLDTVKSSKQTQSDKLEKAFPTGEELESMKKDYYKILSVEPTVSQTEIEEAADRLVTVWSSITPKNDPNFMRHSKMLSDIQEAIFILKDPVRRLKYDLQKGFKEEQDCNSQDLPTKVKAAESKENLNAIEIQKPIHRNEFIKSLSTTDAWKRSIKKDYYKTLSVEPTASQNEIEEAANGLLTDLHSVTPENGPDFSRHAEILSDIQEAIFILKDPVRRLKYDLQQGFIRKPPRNNERDGSLPPKLKFSESIESLDAFGIQHIDDSRKSLAVTEKLKNKNMSPDYYQILSVEPTASQTEIKEAADRLVTVWSSITPLNDPNFLRHSKMLHDIQEAFFILKDHDRRFKYDLQKGLRKEQDCDPQNIPLNLKVCESKDNVNTAEDQEQIHRDEFINSLAATDAWKKSIRKDYYKILSVEPTASQTEIKEAADRLLTDLSFIRPENVPDFKQPAEILHDIHEAIFILNHPVRRLKYDLQQGFRGKSAINNKKNDSLPLKLKFSESKESLDTIKIQHNNKLGKSSAVTEKLKNKNMSKDYYQILSVEPTATQTEIEEAADRLETVWGSVTPQNDPNFMRHSKLVSDIREAIFILKNPARRLEYDLSMGFKKDPSSKPKEDTCVKKKVTASESIESLDTVKFQKHIRHDRSPKTAKSVETPDITKAFSFQVILAHSLETPEIIRNVTEDEQCKPNIIQRFNSNTHIFEENKKEKVKSKHSLNAEQNLKNHRRVSKNKEEKAKPNRSSPSKTSKSEVNNKLSSLHHKTLNLEKDSKKNELSPCKSFDNMREETEIEQSDLTSISAESLLNYETNNGSSTSGAFMLSSGSDIDFSDYNNSNSSEITTKTQYPTYSKLPSNRAKLFLSEPTDLKRKPAESSNGEEKASIESKCYSSSSKGFYILTDLYQPSKLKINDDRKIFNTMNSKINQSDEDLQNDRSSIFQDSFTNNINVQNTKNHEEKNSKESTKEDDIEGKLFAKKLLKETEFPLSMVKKTSSESLRSSSDSDIKVSEEKNILSTENEINTAGASNSSSKNDAFEEMRQRKNMNSTKNLISEWMFI